MCDYSLESYKSRAAENDEDLVVKQFSSGSKGFVSAADPDCAVCCKDSVEMTLHLSGTFQTRSVRRGELDDARDENLFGEYPVTFHTLVKSPTLPWGGQHSHFYRDGFMLPNGRYLSIQRLTPGTRATVTKALPKEITEAAKGEKAFEPEIRVQEIVAPVMVD
jgi:hypothetical protein